MTLEELFLFPRKDAVRKFLYLYFRYWKERMKGQVGRIAQKTGVERSNLYKCLRRLGLYP